MRRRSVASSFAGIALIGLRGAGKSTLGRMLAKKIGWNFVELNKEIEAQNGLSVAEIIALYGQEGFRRLEQAALTQLLARKELTVLATGGGIVSEPLTFDLILSSFYTIWLKAEPEEHMARVRKQGDLRPMADDRSAMAELRNILVSREPLYARASAVVDTAGLTVDAAAARLTDAVAPVLQNEPKRSACAAPRVDRACLRRDLIRSVAVTFSPLSQQRQKALDHLVGRNAVDMRADIDRSDDDAVVALHGHGDRTEMRLGLAIDQGIAARAIGMMAASSRFGSVTVCGVSASRFIALRVASSTRHRRAGRA